MSDDLKVKIRRNQLISPWGVGSVMPLPNDESCVIGGLSGWDNADQAFRIYDDRLQAYLGVSSLRWPPYYKESSNYGYSNGFSNDLKKEIPVFRFPNWYYCPKCGHMEWVDPCDGNTCIICPECFRHQKTVRMVPERFILACPNGHVSDLPILGMIHGQNFDSQRWKTDPVFKKQHRIIRISGGRSTSLAGIFYKCIDCKKEVSLATIIGQGAVAKYLDKCPGNRPWIGDHVECDCPAGKLAVVQRGATNVWFSQIFSSIYIPLNLHDGSDPAYVKAIEENKTMIDLFGTENGGAPVTCLTKIAQRRGLDLQILIATWEKRYAAAPTLSTPAIMSDSEYRYKEYLALSNSCCSDNEDLYVKSVPISKYSAVFASYFDGVSLVTKLKETRVLVGFSRLNPPSKSIEDAKKDLTADGSVSWLPAIQNYGEGIFLRFNEKAVAEWAKNKAVIERAKIVDKNYQKSGLPKRDLQNISPEYLLIHTFGHLLINQLGKHCGYGSSSVRERLYISSNQDTKMLGILLYTSSGDSEGSLGGLVKQGKPGKLENHVYVALQEALWCSADPICIESKGQGPDSCNLAACHNCAILPETCCETGNRFLDRGLVIGVIGSDSKLGFFSDMLDLAQK